VTPRACASRATAASFASSLSMRKRAAPSRASARATARPRPAAAPVTKALFPRMTCMLGALLTLGTPCGRFAAALSRHGYNRTGGAVDLSADTLLAHATTAIGAKAFSGRRCHGARPGLGGAIGRGTSCRSGVLLFGVDLIDEGCA